MKKDVFKKLIQVAETPEEKEMIEKLISMIMEFRKHEVLRKKLKE